LPKPFQWGTLLDERLQEDLSIPQDRIQEIKEATRENKSFDWLKISRRLGKNPEETRRCWKRFTESIEAIPIPAAQIDELPRHEDIDVACRNCLELREERKEEIWKQKPKKPLSQIQSLMQRSLCKYWSLDYEISARKEENIFEGPLANIKETQALQPFDYKRICAEFLLGPKQFPASLS
jgi:hypothetical protein